MKALKYGLLLVAGLLLLSVLAVYVLWMPTAKELGYALVKTWGSQGSDAGAFNEPTGIAVYGAEVFVSDSRNARIQVFDLDGTFKRQFGQSGQGALARPMNITVANGQLYVADFFADRVNRYTLDGKFIGAIGGPGSEKGQFNAPGGVAVSRDGNIMVADFYNQRIQKLTADGTFIRQWGQSGEAGFIGGKLNYPTDVAVNNEGTIYIADGYNDRILAYADDGTLLRKWGGPLAMNIFGSFNGWFATVTGIAIGPAGNVYVADFYNDRIQKFNAGGEFLSAFGVDSVGPTHTAIAVSVADDGSVFVADYANHQIQKWQQTQ